MSNNMRFYKMMRPILGFIYKVYYNPKIIGLENIPSDGPILIVGTHIHIMDQCNLIISTKRPIHYMAKKEYFDSKFAWFFKMVGCIPVDRSIHDQNAKGAALEVLKEGKALGLFPEGTRNGLKEEKIKELYNEYFDELNYKDFYKKVKKNKTSQVLYLEKLMEDNLISLDEFKDNIYNVDSYLKTLITLNKITEKDYYDNILLPFKFGAVSMGNKTDAYLVPFAITGEYKFRSKNLCVAIGKPFKVKSNDLEKYNQKLKNEVIKLIKTAEKISGK